MEGMSTLVGAWHAESAAIDGPCKRGEAFDGGGVVDHRPYVGVGGNHLLPFLVDARTRGDEEIHGPSGLLDQSAEQPFALLVDDPEERVGNEVELRFELLEHRRCGAEIDNQQRLVGEKVGMASHGVVERGAVGEDDKLIGVAQAGGQGRRAARLQRNLDDAEE